MPSYLQGQLRDQLRFIKVFSDGNLYYGFNTKDFSDNAGVSDADTSILGHLQVGSVPASAIRVFGANSPKPPRMKKVINANPTVAQIESISTFVAPDSVAAAEQQGWKIVKRPLNVSFSYGERSVTALAELSNGGLYAFPQNRATHDAVASELGLINKTELSSAERKKAFTGTSRPRPAEVRKKGTNSGRLKSFCSTSSVNTALDGEWELLKDEFKY